MSTKKEMGIGVRLKTYRKQKNLTLQALGEKIGLSHGSLSSIENQKTAPSAETLQNLCLYTDIDITWLLTGEGPKRIPQSEQPQAPQAAPGSKNPSADFLTDLETWAREISEPPGNLKWLEKQLETCLPTWKTWREAKEEEAKKTALPADKVA